MYLRRMLDSVFLTNVCQPPSVCLLFWFLSDLHISSFVSCFVRREDSRAATEADTFCPCAVTDRCAGGERDVEEEDLRGNLVGLHQARLGSSEVTTLSSSKPSTATGNRKQEDKHQHSNVTGFCSCHKSHETTKHRFTRQNQHESSAF